LTTSRPVAIALVADLMLASRVETGLVRAGYEVRVVDDRPAFEAALAAPAVAVVIFDIHSGIEAAFVVEASAAKGAPVLAFGRHTEPELLRAARVAGCQAVVPRSEIVESLPELVAKVRAAGVSAAGS
jgi:hypothetical protein